MVDYLSSTYGVGSNDVKLTDHQVEDQTSWDYATKYVDKYKSGNHYMIHQKQQFFYQTWGESRVPKFATMYVLDTSGSMGDSDYTQVKRAITSEIYEYNCYDLETTSSKMFVYSGTYLSNMQVSDSVFGTIPFGSASLSEIWHKVSPFVNGIAKNGGSESMITVLYYSISDFIKRMFDSGENSTRPGKDCNIQSASFILLTDESIFTDDTLQNVDYLWDSRSKWYSEWFHIWMLTATNKFPVSLTTGGIAEEKKFKRRKFCKDITNAMKQMSYYYGVNFTWGLYGGLSTDSYDIDAVKTDGNACWLTKVTALDPSSEQISRLDGEEAWTISPNFHISYPHEGMQRIALQIPDGYIQDGMDALVDGITMQPSDQFNQTSVLSHFHKDSNSEYSAFRFFDEKEETEPRQVRLPATSDMNLRPGTYHWGVFGPDQNTTNQSINPTKNIECGGIYNVDYEDTVWVNERETVVIKLIQDE